jgi:hypothetical protein
VCMRPSTGHLCIDLAPPETNAVDMCYVDCAPLSSGTSLLTPPSESEMIMSMSLRDYHGICDGYLAHVDSWLVSPNVSVNLGSIRYSSRPEYEGSLEVASSDCRIYDLGWSTMDQIVEGYLHP